MWYTHLFYAQCLHGKCTILTNLLYQMASVIFWAIWRCRLAKVAYQSCGTVFSYCWRVIWVHHVDMLCIIFVIRLVPVISSVTIAWNLSVASVQFCCTFLGVDIFLESDLWEALAWASSKVGPCISSASYTILILRANLFGRFLWLWECCILG